VLLQRYKEKLKDKGGKVESFSDAKRFFDI
jgi:hypothetical protein